MAISSSTDRPGQIASSINATGFGRWGAWLGYVCTSTGAKEGGVTPYQKKEEIQSWVGAAGGQLKRGFGGVGGRDREKCPGLSYHKEVSGKQKYLTRIFNTCPSTTKHPSFRKKYKILRGEKKNTWVIDPRRIISGNTKCWVLSLGWRSEARRL